MQELEQTINSFFNEKYKYLHDIANNLLRTLDNPKFKITSHKLNTKEMRDDLITETYKYVDDNKTKLRDKIILSGMLESICVRWMDRQIKWSGTHFKRNYLYPRTQTNELFLVDEDQLDGWEYDELTEDEHYQEQMMHQERLFRLAALREKMTEPQRCLFNDVYILGYNSTDKLHQYYQQHSKESRTSCYNMLRDLRLFIKQNL